MSEVFPKCSTQKKRPWIDAEGASTEEIINQVKKCPSGALTTYLNNEKMEKNENKGVDVTLTKNGPILINGPIQMKDSSGNTIETASTCALCRCGGSSNKPFCDGTHNNIGFEG